MLYFLDKYEITANNLPKMYYKTEEILTEEEKNKIIQECSNLFNSEIVTYEADYLPSKLYIDENNIVQEYTPIATFIQERTIQELPKIYTEDILGPEDNNNYYYIDREECIKNYSPCICRVSKGRRLSNYKELYNGTVLEYVGFNMSDLPNDIIYEPDRDLVRAMTEYEKIKYNKRQLNENEVVLKIKKEVITLEEGQYVDETENIITVPKLDVLKQNWDKVSHAWIDVTTEKERADHYKELINTYKSEILQNGFDFNRHQQKCREKDLALLGNAVSALDDMQTFAVSQVEHKINWAFNDNDIVVMTETDLRKMRIAGATFINNVYAAEAKFKSLTPNHKFTKQEFIDEINLNSEVKCYSQHEIV